MGAPFKKTRTLSLDEIAMQVIAEVKKQLQTQNENVKERLYGLCDRRNIRTARHK